MHKNSLSNLEIPAASRLAEQQRAAVREWGRQMLAGFYPRNAARSLPRSNIYESRNRLGGW
jgi:hypothetical protein